jgi:hypothetical protein
MEEYGWSLEKLQELRDEATGEKKLEYQKLVDNYFFRKESKGQKKKKKKKKIRNEDDMWW